MEMTTYYGMDKNPFIKDAAVSTLFTSNDFKQMTNRLEFIIRSRGIGVFLSSPGMGKTTCLRKHWKHSIRTVMSSSIYA